MLRYLPYLRKAGFRTSSVLGNTRLSPNYFGAIRYTGEALDPIVATPVKSSRMPRAQQRSAPRHYLLMFAVASTIALLLLFSITLASSAGDGFHHIALTLPVLFLLLVLTACVGGWLQPEDVFPRPKPAAPACPTRAPPTSIF